MQLIRSRVISDYAKPRLTLSAALLFVAALSGQSRAYHIAIMGTVIKTAH